MSPNSVAVSGLLVYIRIIIIKHIHMHLHRHTHTRSSKVLTLFSPQMRRLGFLPIMIKSVIHGALRVLPV